MTPDEAKTLAYADSVIAGARQALEEMRRMVRECEAIVETALAARRYYVRQISAGERDGATLQ